MFLESYKYINTEIKEWLKIILQNTRYLEF